MTAEGTVGAPTCSSYKIGAKMKRNSTSGSLPWGGKLLLSTSIRAGFQDFLEFLNGAFLLNIKD
jgi:hypothetical protein